MNLRFHKSRGRRAQGEIPGGGAKKKREPNRLRPDLRTTYADGGRTPQIPEHCLSRFLASLFRDLLIGGSHAIGVSRS